MSFENRKWVILNVSDVTDEMISSSIQTSRDTLVKNLDGSKTILKWDGNIPSCFDGMTNYNKSEILNIIKREDW
jgi:hypothetical protein